MGVTSTWLIYGFAFASAFLAMQAVIGAGRQSARKIAWANLRMKMKAGGGSQTDILTALRKSRGLERGQGNGRGLLGAVAWLDKQVTQSGLPLGVFGIYLIMVGASAALFLAVLILKSSFWLSLAGAAAGLVLPVFILRFLVKRRRSKAVAQLPAALDVIVRSLRAGHPVPVAIELVAREMPDPVGTEFGMASDEITYGTGLGKALQRLADRVGHSDFDLLAATIRLQERTGGNLAELLQSNAHMVRERQKMRLKIKSASSEGRMSALILNIAPILLFFAVQFVSPDFYGNVNEEPIVKKGMIAIGIWMLIGNLVMRKMINFRI